MALLRNREVKILRTVEEIDGSTFEVEYLDRETEYAKMHELQFTRDEYDRFVQPLLPEINIIDKEDKKRK